MAKRSLDDSGKSGVLVQPKEADCLPEEIPCNAESPLKLEVDEYPPEVFIVLLDAMIKLFDVPLIQKAQDLFLELPAALAGDDLNQFYFPVHCFFHNAIQFCLDLLATIINVM
jgi:hypothetical protein